MIVGAAIAALVLAPGPIPSLATMIAAGVGNALFHLGAGGLVLRSCRRASRTGRGVRGAGSARPGPRPVDGAHGPGLDLSHLRRPGLCGHRAHHPGQAGCRGTEHAEPVRGRSNMASSFSLAGPLDASARVGRGPFLCWLRRLLPVPRGIGGGDRVAVAAFLGKLLGGMVADRLGWLRASIGALLLSLPLIAFLRRLTRLGAAWGPAFPKHDGCHFGCRVRAHAPLASDRVRPALPGAGCGLVPDFLSRGKAALRPLDIRTAHRFLGRGSRPRPAQAQHVTAWPGIELLGNAEQWRESIPRLKLAALAHNAHNHARLRLKAKRK
jgi:hypothetical protein